MGDFEINYCSPKTNGSLQDDKICHVNDPAEAALIKDKPSFPTWTNNEIDKKAKQYGLDAHQLKSIASPPFHFKDFVSSAEADPRMYKDPYHDAVKKKMESVCKREGEKNPAYAANLFKGIEAFEKVDKNKDGIIDQKEFTKATVEQAGALVRFYWMMKLENPEREAPMTEAGAYYYCSGVATRLPVCRVNEATDLYFLLGGSSYPYKENITAGARDSHYTAAQVKQMNGVLNMGGKAVPIDFAKIVGTKETRKTVIKKTEALIERLKKLSNKLLAEDLQKTLDVYKKVDANQNGNIDQEEFKKVNNEQALRLIKLTTILEKSPEYLTRMEASNVAPAGKPATNPGGNE